MDEQNGHSTYWGGERSRCLITTPQGERVWLSVPMKKHSNEICYMHRWQHQHWMALVSAYGKSPYFEYYRDYIEPIYRREWRTIDELNERTAAIVESILRNERPEEDSTATNEVKNERLLDLLFEYGPEAGRRIC